MLPGAVGMESAPETNTDLTTGLGQQGRVKRVIQCQIKGGFSPLPAWGGITQTLLF